MADSWHRFIVYASVKNREVEAVTVKKPLLNSAFCSEVSRSEINRVPEADSDHGTRLFF